MPELPEVEVLARHLSRMLRRRTVRGVRVSRPRILGPTSERELSGAMQDATFLDVTRRGKYLVFKMRPPRRRRNFVLVGHLGMTGRMYLQDKNAPLPKHTAVAMDLGKDNFVFEDTRYFGRLTLDGGALERLGPEPFGREFAAEYLEAALKRSSQAIKVKLLDQSLVAGVGNIYASEALFRAAISPKMPAKRLDAAQVRRLRRAIRQVLADAIKRGSTLPIDLNRNGARDGLFYFGSAAGPNEFSAERLLVYDRRGMPCEKCGTKIERIVQAARSTFFCPKCQSRGQRGAKMS